MSIFKDDEESHIPEDNDPAYQNPIGKVPEKQATPQPVKQPFDCLATGLHTPSERSDFGDTVVTQKFGDLMEKEALRAAAWSKKLGRLEQTAHNMWQTAKPDSPEEAKWLRTMKMQQRARDVWNTEIAMLVRELRKELRELLKEEYPDESKELQHDLAWDEA